MVILGADFSSFQPNVDWSTYRAMGRQFAMIKATESVDYINPLFTEQVDGAQSAAVAVGCYHYYAWQDAEYEAIWFVESVKATTVLTGVPLAIDVERGRYPVPPNPQTQLNAFLLAVERLAGYPPIVYSSAAYLASIGLVVPPRNGWWAALWGSVVPPGFWAIWQHAASQSIPGSPNPTDSDIFNGTVDQFRLYGGR